MEAKEAAAVEVPQQAVQPAPSPAPTRKGLPYNIDVLSITKEAQNQHGLRHGDHLRYRQYCARRIQRMRTATHTTQKSKGKNLKPLEIDEQHVKEIRSLHILLFDTERAWSYAMQLKEESATETRKHHHMMKRFKKAADLAADLSRLATKFCDERTQLDTAAYANWLKGLHLLEQKKWQEALDELTASRTAYLKLAASGKPEQEALCNSRIEEIDPSLRFCIYNLTKKDGTTPANLSKILEQTEKVVRAEQAEVISSVEWLGKVLLIKNQKLKEKLNNTKAIESEIQASPSADARLQLYDKLLLAYNEASNLALADIKSDEAAAAKAKSSKGDENSANLKSIHGFILYTRLGKVIERNWLLVENAKKELDAKKGAESAGKTKPEDLVRLQENIYQNLLEIREISGIAEDLKISRDLEAKISITKAFRVFYAGYAFENGSKWSEALTLFIRAEQLATEALSLLGDLLSKEQSTREQANLKDLQKAIRSHKSVVKASGYLEGKEGSEQASQSQISVEDIDPKNPKLVAFPPTFEAIPCKPVVFDLAGNFIDFPSVSHRSKQAQGITGFISGFWGR